MQTNKKSFTKLVIVFAITIAATTFAAAQDGVQTRSATSDDFVVRRPAKPNVRVPKSTPVRPGPKFAFVAANRNAVRWGHGRKAPAPKPANTPTKITTVGVTVWKMRPPRPGEGGILLPVKINDTTVAQWLPERVGADKVFKKGDKVRLAVESSGNGYLYIFDREIYSDGTFGEPKLTFPDSLKQDNSMSPGMLADIPDQHEKLPYFSMNSDNPNYRGELLTVVISPRPWVNIRLSEEGFMTNADDLLDLEFGADVEIFGRTDNADGIYSKAESEAACGAKTRQLERDKPTQAPCGAKSRQLTRDEPLPQAIYSLKSFTGQPAVAFVRLSVR